MVWKIQSIKGGNLKNTISLAELEEMCACQEARMKFMAAFGAMASIKDVVLSLHSQNREDWEVWLLTRNHELTKALLENGANVHAQNDYALSCAANLGNYTLVSTLLSYGADARARDGSAIFWAKKGGHDRVVNLLEESLKNKQKLRL